MPDESVGVLPVRIAGGLPETAMYRMLWESLPMKKIGCCGAAVAGFLIMGTMAVAADEAEIGRNVSVELNAVRASEAGCMLSFVVINGHESQIDKAVYETVLFDSAGQVDRLTLFDFGVLPPGRPRVRQFTVPGMACEGLGQILINGAHSCESEGLAGDACEAGLELRSRVNIEVMG